MSERKFILKAEILNPDYKLSFKILDVLVKTRFVCYLDFETVLIPVDSSSGVRSACHRYEALAVEYIMVDSFLKVNAFGCFIGVDIISEKLQQSTLDEYRKLYKRIS